MNGHVNHRIPQTSPCSVTTSDLPLPQMATSVVPIVKRSAGDHLRIASLAKQVPLAESLRLEDGRLIRSGVVVEMNPYCRRAVAKGVELARDTGGSCTVVTLGPSSADDVLREAVAWGADEGLHLCDNAFAGSDSLATAQALATALRARGPYDLILLGRNSVDGETGQGRARVGRAARPPVRQWSAPAGRPRAGAVARARAR